MGKLYGALSAIIVFMLWLYVLMICFVVGVIFNSEKISARESKTLWFHAVPPPYVRLSKQFEKLDF